jgi:hypothetical protein
LGPFGKWKPLGDVQLRVAQIFHCDMVQERKLIEETTHV